MFGFVLEIMGSLVVPQQDSLLGGWWRKMAGENNTRLTHFPRNNMKLSLSFLHTLSTLRLKPALWSQFLIIVAEQYEPSPACYFYNTIKSLYLPSIR